MPETEQKETATKEKPIFKVVLVALLLIQASLLTYLSWSTSPNRTEVGHLGAAVYFWNFGKFDVFHVNPPLVRIITGAPIALFCKPKYDWKAHSTRPLARSEWPLGNTFLSINNIDDIRCYMFLARLACVPLVLLGGYIGFRFASELYGEWSGVVFLTLWTFSPLILGWGATICPDVAAASMGIVGLYTFWHWLKNPGWQKAIIAGICLGLMPLAKTTWILAFPLWVGLWLAWQLASPGKERVWKTGQLLTVLLVGVYFLNMGYMFEGTCRPLEKYQFASETLSGNQIENEVILGNRFENSWLGKLPVPLPKEFVQGIDTQKRDFEKGFESYLCGQYSDRGWWLYYLYVIALKEPVGTLVLGVAALLATFFCRRFNSSLRNEMLLVLPAVGLFLFISSQSGISLHGRYIVPVLPLLYVWMSKLGKAFEWRGGLCKYVVILCLIGMAGSSLYRYPYSLSYFNELVGGPAHGGEYLLGSAVDWGQDEYELRDWIKRHPDAKPLYITYQPSIPLSNLGVSYSGPVPEKPVEGWMVLGINDLYRRDGRYAEYRELRPAARIGWGIVVFRAEFSEK